MGDSLWEAYKPELHRLYIREGMTLSAVMEYMESKYSFDKTKAQYTKHLGKWGFQKNQKVSASDAVFIERRIQKRKQVFDKESEVYIGGVEYPPKKHKKAPYGKAYVSTTERLRLAGAPSPCTPEGIVVCTPATPGMRLNWDLSLPWLRFSKLLRPPTQDGDLPSTSPTLAVTSPRGINVPSYAPNKELLKRLGSVVPWNQLTHPPNVNSCSRTATALSIIMPEESEGQLRGLANRFAESKQSIIDTLEVEMFLLSNNLVSHGSNGKTFSSMRSHDQRVLEMFRVSSWNNMTRLKVLVSSQEPTAGAIAEQLFASSVREMEIGSVRMLLEAGMSPNGYIDTVDEGPLTPLQYATLAVDPMEPESLQLLELLLSHGADHDKSSNNIPPLGYALQIHSLEAIEILLSHEAYVTLSCLEIAAYSLKNDPELFKLLLGPGPYVNPQSVLQGSSILSEAVKGGNTEIIKVLLDRGADMNSLVDIEFDGDWAVTTVLGYAVKSARLEIIEVLLHACPDVNPNIDELPYVPPLVLAVARVATDPRLVNLLLQKGFDVQSADDCGTKTLLERALIAKNTSMCEILIRNGARIDRPLSDKEHTTSALVCAIQTGAAEVARLLIRMGARLNDSYSSSSGSVLGAAIRQGDMIVLDMVWTAGAVSISPRLGRIGNMETAVYLEQRGLLAGILNMAGTLILGAALSYKDDGLVSMLLSYTFDLNCVTLGAWTHGYPLSHKDPLKAAILNGRPSFVYALLGRGAKVTDSDITYLVACLDRIDPTEGTELLQRLLKDFQGAAPTAIAEAILSDRLDLFNYLLAAHIDPRGKPQQLLDVWDFNAAGDCHLDPPESVLEIACKTGNMKVLEALFRVWPWDSRLVGRALTLSILFNHIEIFEYLLERAPDINQEIAIHHPYTKDKEGFFVSGHTEVVTPLQIASRDQRVSVVQRLLGHPNIDVNYLGAGLRRRTALQHAVGNGNMELINLFLSRGADINSCPARYGGATALQIAAIQGYLGIACRLIHLHANINAPPAIINGRTALEGAAEHGRIDMLQMLLDRGASVTGNDGQRQYRRAIEFAERNGHHAAARLLMAFEPWGV